MLKISLFQLTNKSIAKTALLSHFQAKLHPTAQNSSARLFFPTTENLAQQDTGFVEAKEGEGKQDRGCHLACGQQKGENHDGDVEIEALAGKIFRGDQAGAADHEHQKRNFEGDAERQHHSADKGQVKSEAGQRLEIRACIAHKEGENPGQDNK